jgi:Na+-translocating ferredoxin:NAD+ oxidoreductase subunit B
MALGFLPVTAAAAIGFALGWIGLRRAQRRAGPLPERIDAVLPQTQCGQCGYQGCRPYAAAIAAGEADINRCPPGGMAIIRRLARITGRPARPLDPSLPPHRPRQLARIDEARCIGCTLCIQACPVDAIVGAPKLMHTVIASHCTGCELCLPPCPVDCIVLEAAPWSALARLRGAPRSAANAARRRYQAGMQRLERERHQHGERLAVEAQAKLAALMGSDRAAAARKRAIIEAALERARARRTAAAETGAAPHSNSAV